MTHRGQSRWKTGNHYSWRRSRARRKEQTLWILLPSSHFLDDDCSAPVFPVMDVVMVLNPKCVDTHSPLVCVALFPLLISVEPGQRSLWKLLPGHCSDWVMFAACMWLLVRDFFHARRKAAQLWDDSLPPAASGCACHVILSKSEGHLSCTRGRGQVAPP